MRQLPRQSHSVKAFRRRWGAAVLLVGVAAGGCDSESTTPGETRFGQVGEVRVEVRTPLGVHFDPVLGTEVPHGYLVENLVWRSTGPWVLAERVSYRGLHGAETLERGRLNPGDLAREYDDFNRLLHESGEYGIFAGQVPQIEPVCDPAGDFPTQVTVTVEDHPRARTERWVRCTAGTLHTLSDGVGWPDVEAARVIDAARLARSFTVGDAGSSTYTSTTPYGTLAQGEYSSTRPMEPIAFISQDGSVPPEFLTFWAAHANPGDFLPSIDWANEIVFLAAVGERGEAGTAVQVERVLPLSGRTRVEIVERVPGDFCTPAARETFPFHLVVLPTVPSPLEFVHKPDVRVPCGL